MKTFECFYVLTENLKMDFLPGNNKIIFVLWVSYDGPLVKNNATKRKRIRNCCKNENKVVRCFKRTKPKEMKGETLQKPPPLVLPPAKHKANPCSKHSSFKDKEKSLEERAVNKFTARYDAFQGILKRVSEMKMSGSLDSEEPSTGSEKSESSRSGHLKLPVRSVSSSIDNRSNVSAFEDESCASSITGSDQCPPYEEIPRVSYGNRYSCSSLPSYPAYAETTVSSFRESFPPPPSPTELYKNVSNQKSSREYKIEKTKRQSSLELTRPKSVIEAGRGSLSPIRLVADVNDNCTKFFGRSFSSEQNGQPEGISEAEKHQIEMFFRSLKTDVFVCGSLANLYFGWKEGEGNWSYRHTGVVVVVFDFGDTRCRSKRKIQILLAEKGTCFPLWKDTIDNLSSYRKSGSAFHTMYLSSDHRQMVGLSFDSCSESDRLLKHLEQLTSNPENINISVPGSRKKKSQTKRKPMPLPHKKHISNPCLFQHVTSVAAQDKPIYMSLQTLIDSENIKKIENVS